LLLNRVRSAPPGRDHSAKTHSKGFALGYYRRLPLGGTPGPARMAYRTRFCNKECSCGCPGVARFHKNHRDCGSCNERERGARRQKNAPVMSGGQVALVLSCCESLIGGQTAGKPPERTEPRREWLRLIRAAPHHSGKPSHGVSRLPGPPNCFPSTEDARCCSGPAW